MFPRNKFDKEQQTNALYEIPHIHTHDKYDCRVCVKYHQLCVMRYAWDFIITCHIVCFKIVPNLIFCCFRSRCFMHDTKNDIWM